MAYYDFSKDIKDGHKAELVVKDILLDKYGFKELHINESTDYSVLKEYDLEGINKKGQRVLIEVKNDLKSSQTGNIAIEYSCNDKPSGVNATKADFWVSVGSSEIFILKIKVLKDLIKKESLRRDVSGGDNKIAKMYLFKIDVIRNNSLCIKL